MRPDFGEGKDTPIETEQEGERGYRRPSVTVLGTVAELTQSNVFPNTDETLNDGTQS